MSSLGNLKVICQEMIDSDNKATQAPIYNVFGISKYSEDDEQEDILLCSCFSQKQADDFIETYEYKYKNLHCFIQSRYANDGFSSLVRAMFEATEMEKPKRYN